MAILIIMPGRESAPLQQALLELDPRLDIRTWPNHGDPEEILCAVTWNHPEGVLGDYPNLSLIHSYGAGVDHLLNDPQLPPDIPICRVVDPGLVRQMGDYLLATLLNHRFGLPGYWQAQHQKIWQARDYQTGNRTGILGLGELGQSVAIRLQENGFEVSGWSRSRKQLSGIISYTGKAELLTLAAAVDYLICLLPLTEKTRGILDHRLFEAMPERAYLVNVGRGEHLINNDLSDALTAGEIAGACLDVTTPEPLPRQHPLWECPNLTITPHISSLSNPQAVAAQVLDNYRRRLSGAPLTHLVDRDRGY